MKKVRHPEKIKVTPYHNLIRSIDGLYFTDLDFVISNRSMKIVALVEVSSNKENEFHILRSLRPRSTVGVFDIIKGQVKIISQIAKALKVPYYYILHDNHMRVFLRFDIVKADGTDGDLSRSSYYRYNYDQHKAFLESLKNL